MGWGALIAGVVAAGASAGGGMSAADSQKDAAAQNAKQEAANRELQAALWRESRGSTGHAFLPYYLGSAEENLGANAIARYDTLNKQAGNTEDEIQKFRQDAARFQPAMQAGDVLVNDIFNGNLTNQKLSNAVEVAQARNDVAQAGADSVYTALSKRLNQLKADRARGGFSGGSTFQDARLTQATIDAMGQAAQQKAAAGLANATERQQIKDSGIDLSLRSLDVPLARARQSQQFINMPDEAAVNAFKTRASIFDPFKIGTTGPAQLSQQTPITAVPSAGQIAAQAIAGGATAAGNVYANNQLNQQYLNFLKQQQIGNAVNSAPTVGSSYGQTMV